MNPMMNKNVNPDDPKIFYDWVYEGRKKAIQELYEGKEISMEKLFLSFTRHEPAFISYGPEGLNAAIKGIGFVLKKKEDMEEALKALIPHIESYDPKNQEEYSKEGLELLMKILYSEDSKEKIDFSVLGSLELAKGQSYKNYLADKEACLLFYQPPMISFKLKGKMEIYDEKTSHKKELIQTWVNALHDTYHAPGNKWIETPAYLFHIEEIYNSSATPNGFGHKLNYKK